MENSNLDFDDSTSIAAMRKLGIREVVSFDRDFDKISGIARIEPKVAVTRVRRSERSRPDGMA